MYASGLSRVIGLDNVRIAQLAKRFHFAVKPLDHLVVLNQLRMQDFKAGVPFQISVTGAVDDAHRTATKLIANTSGIILSPVRSNESYAPCHNPTDDYAQISNPRVKCRHKNTSCDDGQLNLCLWAS